MAAKARHQQTTAKRKSVKKKSTTAKRGSGKKRTAKKKAPAKSISTDSVEQAEEPNPFDQPISKTVGQRLEDEAHADMVSRARQKIQANPNAKLNDKERRAIRKEEQSQIERWGMRLLRECPKKIAVQMLRTSTHNIRDNQKRRGFPWPEDSNFVDISDLLSWFWRYFLETNPNGPGGRLAPTGSDSGEAVLIAGASKAVKDQLLLAQVEEKQTQNKIRELELRHRVENFLPIDHIRAGLGEIAEIVKRNRVAIAKRIEIADSTDEAAKIIDEAFEELAEDMIQSVDRLFPKDG